AQVGENRYLVYFADKDNTPYSIEEPEQFLSVRAINRRLNQSISITVEDLPVDPAYIQQILDLGEVELIYPLKWFNAVLIESADSAKIDEIEDLAFVVGTRMSTFINNDLDQESIDSKFTSYRKNEEEYGPSFNQIDMINGLPLHEAGFKGEGVWVGVFDGGFSFTNTALALEEFMESGRLLGTKDFIDGDDEVFHRSTHGTRVLSTMTGLIPGSLIGTAPEASYLLCITEDVQIERRIEEANWAAAAEYADSVGVDIINTSLGYTLFDLDEEDHSYEGLDGNSTLITRASNIATSKGILTVNSAGNSGNSDWYYIGAPADGDKVLAVGAVNADEEVVGFSSRGPRVDGAIKPNVMARGFQAIGTDLDQGITGINGTSFSAPIISGMAASLWQAVPNATAEEVFDAIEQSAHLYDMPNDSMGYGIPDFALALSLLQPLSDNVNLGNGINRVGVYPNPIDNGQTLTLTLPEAFGESLFVEIFDITGKLAYSERLVAQSHRASLPSTLNINTGLYILNVRDEIGRTATSKLIVR
ncbi:MAG: S8 family serine peptidase, partial [Bacteroidota bacterium]